MHVLGRTLLSVQVSTLLLMWRGRPRPRLAITDQVKATCALKSGNAA